MDKLSFRFHGKLADGHELIFYEMSRFEYGAARFVYTIEKFRQSGTVVKAIRTRVDADIRVRAAKRGSWWQDLLIYALPSIAECAINVSFEAMFAYAMSKIFPESKAKDAAVELADFALKSQIEHTKQIQIIADVTKEGFANSNRAIKILGEVLENYEQFKKAGVRYSEKDIETLLVEEEDSKLRDRLVRQYRSEFRKINPRTERQLVEQLRARLEIWPFL